MELNAPTIIADADLDFEWSQVNVFEHLGFLIVTVRISLDEEQAEAEVARFLEILKINTEEVIDNDLLEAIRTGIKATMNGVSEFIIFAVNKMIDLVLTAKEVLSVSQPLSAQLDAYYILLKELLPISISLSKAVTLNDLIETEYTISFMPDSGSEDELKEKLNNLLEQLKGALDAIPLEETLDILGHELYLLAQVSHAQNGQIDVLQSGKVRLLQYGFQDTWHAQQTDSRQLGKRRPGSGQSGEENFAGIRLFDYPGADEDQDEADAMMDKLNYPTENRIKLFQKVNQLPDTGIWDHATLNRLFDLDAGRQNLIRAKAYANETVDPVQIRGTLKVINPGGEELPANPIRKQRGKYDYYMIEAVNSEVVWDNVGTGNENIGWRAARLGGIAGFIAMQSRKKVSDNPYRMYEGSTGGISEGPAYDGNYFFTARHTEPWIAGRGGEPRNNIYEETRPYPFKSGQVSRMFQVIPIDPAIWENLSSTGYSQLNLMTTCRVRVMYREKPDTDKGRMRLQVLTYEPEGNSFQEVPLGTEANSPWYPSNLDEKTFDQRRRGTANPWAELKTGVTLDAAALDQINDQKLYLRIYLEGRNDANWDIDAYFDQVTASWHYS